MSEEKCPGCQLEYMSRHEIAAEAGKEIDRLRSRLEAYEKAGPGDDSTGEALGWVGKYGELKYPVGEDRAFLNEAAKRLAPALRAAWKALAEEKERSTEQEGFASEYQRLWHREAAKIKELETSIFVGENMSAAEVTKHLLTCAARAEAAEERANKLEAEIQSLTGSAYKRGLEDGAKRMENGRVKAEAKVAALTQDCEKNHDLTIMLLEKDLREALADKSTLQRKLDGVTITMREGTAARIAALEAENAVMRDEGAAERDSLAAVVSDLKRHINTAREVALGYGFCYYCQASEGCEHAEFCKARAFASPATPREGKP